MPGLPELQRAFSAALRSGDAAGIATWVRADGLTAPRRVQIYRNNLVVTLTEALRAVYPVVDRLVGDGFFRFAAHEFLQRHPSRHGNLHRFGLEFGAFLCAFEPANDHPYLGDVARLEWARHEVYHAAEHPPLDPRSLAAVDPDRYESLRFSLHPARRLLDSRYPVVRIWEVNQPEFGADQTVDLSAPGDRVLVLRNNGDIEFHRLAAAEYRFLTAIRDHHPLGEAVAAALEQESDFDLNRALTRHVQNGTLAAFDQA